MSDNGNNWRVVYPRSGETVLVFNVKRLLGLGVITWPVTRACLELEMLDGVTRHIVYLGGLEYVVRALAPWLHVGGPDPPVGIEADVVTFPAVMLDRAEHHIWVRRQELHLAYELVPLMCTGTMDESDRGLQCLQGSGIRVDFGLLNGDDQPGVRPSQYNEFKGG